ncbi:transmembrane protein 182 [Trichomycterus rosablanca]|uniref:transmembrane protein 182 n=1 Tax=Trichomycterus rosablanca TaxID=2290929 RepID=UPI002F35CFEE
MRLAVLQFMAGFCGALGCLFFLLCLGTDYWLLASESCDTEDKKAAELRGLFTKDRLHKKPNETTSKVTSYHEGIFWRCSYRNQAGQEEKSILDFWITNQPTEKNCILAYLPNVPLSVEESGIITPDSTTIHRAFWCIMSVLGFTMILTGAFVTICGIPTTSWRLYEAGGALFITGGLLLLAVVVTFALWVEDSAALEQYILHRRFSVCPGLHLNLYYGPSFMLAPSASFFCLLCGLFILLAEKALKTESANAANNSCSKQDDFEVNMM